MKLTISCHYLFLLIFLTACTGSLFPASVQTATPIPVTTTATPTTFWFPPTNTPTIFPTQTMVVTPEQRPGLGQLLFTDSFDQPALWNISQGSYAGASVTRNRLILSISGPGPLSMTSLRSQPLLGDFYAEATVRLSLCGGKDQFGMLFRTSPGENYYRFTVRCDGQARLERSLSGSVAPLLDWQPSSDAPLSAPAEIKLGLWAVGSELRFFLNDHYQFTVLDPVLHTGALGFFVYASGASPVTASFADLMVYSVSYTSPTPTPTASRTPPSDP
jgi:hypothetical protein